MLSRRILAFFILVFESAIHYLTWLLEAQVYLANDIVVVFINSIQKFRVALIILSLVVSTLTLIILKACLKVLTLYCLHLILVYLFHLLNKVILVILIYLMLCSDNKVEVLGWNSPFTPSLIQSYLSLIVFFETLELSFDNLQVILWNCIIFLEQLFWRFVRILGRNSLLDILNRCLLTWID